METIINKLQPKFKKKLKTISSQVERLCNELDACDHMPVCSESIERSLIAIQESSKIVGKISTMQTIMWNNNIGLNREEKYILNNILNAYKSVFYEYLAD